MAAEDIYQSIGRNIRAARGKRGWTQEQLAEKADLHPAFLGQIERGIKKPSLKTLKQVADALCLKAGDLLDETAPHRRKRAARTDLVSDFFRAYKPGDLKVFYKTLRTLARQIKKLGRLSA